MQFPTLEAHFVANAAAMLPMKYPGETDDGRMDRSSWNFLTRRLGLKCLQFLCSSATSVGVCGRINELNGCRFAHPDVFEWRGQL